MKLSFLCFSLIFGSCSSPQKEDIQVSEKADTAIPRTAHSFIPDQIENIESHYLNGRLKIKGVMKNGKREGLWISWYDSGQEWSECAYKDGLKNGNTSSWHENGMRRYDGFYKDDVKSGKWTYWDDKGK